MAQLDLFCETATFSAVFRGSLSWSNCYVAV